MCFVFTLCKFVGFALFVGSIIGSEGFRSAAAAEVSAFASPPDPVP